MKKILSTTFRYVYCHQSSLYRTLAKHDKGKRFRLDEPFSDHGQPPSLKQAEIQECAKSLKASPGEKYVVVVEEVNDMLVQSMRQKGNAPAADHMFNTTTLNNYTLVLASAGCISLQDKSIAKTNNRWTAERSAIGTMALISIVVMTHFYVVAEEDVKWREKSGHLIIRA